MQSNMSLLKLKVHYGFLFSKRDKRKKFYDFSFMIKELHLNMMAAGTNTLMLKFLWVLKTGKLDVQVKHFHYVSSHTKPQKVV